MKTKIFKCTLGFDAKIKPDGGPIIIEINGSNSGIAGLEKLTGQNIAAIREKIREQVLGKEAEATMSLSLVSTVDNPAPGIETPYYHRLVFNPLAPQIVTSDIQGERRYYEVHAQPEKLDNIGSDKVEQKRYIEPRFRAPFRVFDGSKDGVTDFVDSVSQSWPDFSDFPYIIGKYSSGYRGENVRIFEHQEIPHMYWFLLMCPEGQQGILEAYVASRDIEGNKNGCMRYLADFFVYRDESGKTVFKKGYEGAYWRIPPGITPESSSDSLQRTYIANFSGKYPAKPFAASEDDISAVRPAVDSTIRNFANDAALFEDGPAPASL